MPIAAARLMVPVRFVIDGEPTDNDLVTGHKGMVIARLEASGDCRSFRLPGER